MRGAQADINFAALRHNFRRVRTLAGSSKILAMIKSDAYGHGAIRVARTLVEADGFGVASLDEAVMLRRAGIPQPLLIMSQFSRSRELSYISEFDLSVVIHNHHQLSIIENYASIKPITVWLKIDTGMHRLGFNYTELASIWQRLQAIAWIKKPICIMTHLACADEADPSVTVAQLTHFTHSTADLPGERSISNSAAILHFPQVQDWVRPGLILYGVSPFAHSQGTEFGLKPVMTLRSSIIAVKHIDVGDRVGYGGCWTCPEPMLMGIIAIGYGDGYPLQLPNGTPVLIKGVICPLIGRVSMDLIAVDLRPCPQAEVDDNVILWGDDALPVERIAEYANTIPYELLCRMGARIRFFEIDKTG